MESREQQYPPTYEFGDCVLDPEDRLLLRNGTAVNLPPKAFETLLVFVESEGRGLSKDEILQKVWSDTFVEEGNVASNVSLLRKELGDTRLNARYIQTIPGRGYRFVAQVRKVPRTNSKELTSATAKPLLSNPQWEDAIPSSPDTGILAQFFGPHSTFIVATAISYGLLFWIVLLLEASYEFNLYGLGAVILGPFLVIINACVQMYAYTFVRKRVEQKKRNPLVIGILLLLLGVAISIGLASLCLPNTPVTLYKDQSQSQPALAAFLKNCLLYLFPLSVLFLLRPFSLVLTLELTKGKMQEPIVNAFFARPKSLMSVLLVAIGYSLITSFIMIDHLKPGTYHVLFVSLVFIRFAMLFGLGLSAVFWYQSAFHKALDDQ